MNKSNKIESKNTRDILALTPMQEGMLFHYLQYPQSGLYFEQLSLEISGEIDGRHFEKAWDAVVDTNEMLRTVFRWEKVERPSQVILKEHKCKVIFYDLSGKDSGQKKPALEEIKNKDRQEAFDLQQVPFRVTLCKLDEREFEMIVGNHHILYDGWSNGIILKEFFKAYHELRQDGRSLKLPAKSPFKEFIKWIQNQDKNRQEQFWRKYLAGFETATELPIKRRLEETKRVELEGYSVILEEEIRKKLDVFVKNNRVTLAAFFYTAWGILLQRYCNSEDVVFGTTVSGRSAGVKGIEDMVGLFINTLPLRIRSGPSVKIIDVLPGIENRLRELEKFENTPLVDIKSYSPVAGSGSLFDTIVVIENYPLDNRLLPEGSLLSVHSYSMVETTHYDLTVGIMLFNEIEIKFSYKRELFEKETIENLAGHFKGIVRNMIENPKNALSQLEIISTEEKNRVLYEFNDTEREYPKDKTIHQLFEEQVERTPDRTALVGPAEEEPFCGQGAFLKNRPLDPQKTFYYLTYNELNERSDRLAGWLIEKGVKPDTIVAIMAERSVEMVIGILGILKSGGTYLPIDPGYPEERIDYMLKDSSAKILVTTSNKEGEMVRSPSRTGFIFIRPFLEQRNGFVEFSMDLGGNFCEFLGRWEGETILLDEIIEFLKSNAYPLTLSTSSSALKNLLPATGNRQPATSLAYIIYTSGSTGKPKGVMVEQIGMTNHIGAKVKELQISRNSVVAQNASHTFDISVWQFFSALTQGGKTVIYPDEVILNPDRFISRLNLDGITILEVVPSYLSVILSLIREKGFTLFYLEYLLVTGEEVKPHLVKQWFETQPGIKMVNAYGPTEASDDIAHHIMDRVPDTDRIPIGKPLQNMKIYIVDNYMQLCPIGVKGELCVSGIGVGRGYLNNAELTAEKFIMPSATRNPFEKGFLDFPKLLFNYHSPLYRTGDLARWLPDGTIEFFGRTDYQVKIHGFRIELGEIENRLLKYPGIKEVVVIDRAEENKNTYLGAYIVSDRKYEISGLREYLAEKLPDYMIPSYFVQMEKIPLTANGKIDRRALPKPGVKAEQNYVAPRSETEAKLVGLWANVLNIQPDVISIDSSFFELGGHSLKATVLVSKIHKVFDVKVPLIEIFKMPRIKELAKYIKEKSKDFYISIEPAEEKEYYSLSSAQKRLYVLQQMNRGNTAYNMPKVIPLSTASDWEKIKEAFKKLIKRHESLRTSFHLVNEEPVQVVHDYVEFEIEYYDLTTEGTENTEKKIHHLIRPFDLTDAPLMRAGIVKNIDGSYILLVDLHHIISDGISHGILVRDYQALYNGEKIPSLRLRYKDFSQWQNSESETGNLERQEGFWIKELEGEIPVLDLPSDYPRPVVQSFEGNNIDFEISAEETQTLNAVALQGGATLFMVLAAIFNILLSKLSGQEEIIMGIPIAGRRHGDLEKIIGMFVNTLALKNYPLGYRTFIEFLGDVKERLLMAFENQEYPFEELVDKLSVRRDIGRNPLFDIMLVLQNMNTGLVGQDKETGLETIRPVQPGYPKEYENIVQTAKFDLTLTAVERDSGLFLSFQYCSKLFKKDTIERFIIYFKKIISIAAKAPEIRINDIEIVSEDEKKRILNDFNQTEAIYPKDKTIHRLFQEQVERTPDHTALHGALRADIDAFGGKAALDDGTDHFARPVRPVQLTYRELNEQSNRLAGLLIEKDVQADNIVGIMIERSVDMIIGILGILKSGGAYLPIDPDYPKERIDYMLKDSSAKILVTTSNKEGEMVRRWEGETILLDEIIEFLKSNAYPLTLSTSSSALKNLLPATGNLSGLHHLYLRLYRETQGGYGETPKHRQLYMVGHQTLYQ